MRNYRPATLAVSGEFPEAWELLPDCLFVSSTSPPPLSVSVWALRALWHCASKWHVLSWSSDLLLSGKANASDVMILIRSHRAKGTLGNVVCGEFTEADGTSLANLVQTRGSSPWKILPMNIHGVVVFWLEILFSDPNIVIKCSGKWRSAHSSKTKFPWRRGRSHRATDAGMRRWGRSPASMGKSGDHKRCIPC